jgi:hypothetical protein
MLFLVLERVSVGKECCADVGAAVFAAMELENGLVVAAVKKGAYRLSEHLNLQIFVPFRLVSPHQRLGLLLNSLHA